MKFYLSREHAVLFSICSMRPERGHAAPVGEPGWLSFMPSGNAIRRAHKIACQKRYKTSRAMFKATRRFRKAFPMVWAEASEHVRRCRLDDECWLSAPLSPEEQARLDDAAKEGGEPW